MHKPNENSEAEEAQLNPEGETEKFYAIANKLQNKETQDLSYTVSPPDPTDT